MAKKSKTPAITFNLDARRIADMAEAIRNNANDVNVDVGLHNEAKDAAKAAGDTVSNTRVKIMFAIADLAIAGEWMPEEIDAAAKIAAKDNTGLEKSGSIKTFLYEICYAAHPAVRDNFRTINEVVELAWANEVEQSVISQGESPTPIAKWAKRKYHALTGAMKAAKNEGILIQEVDTLVAYARENDPDHNIGKVFKKLAKLRDDLRGFNGDFPVDDIGLAIEKLEGVTVEHLKAAQERKQALAEQDIQDIRDNTPVVTPPLNTSVVNPVDNTVAQPPSAPPAATTPKASPFVTQATPAAITQRPVAPVQAPVQAPIKDVLADALNEPAGEHDVDALLGDNLAA